MFKLFIYWEIMCSIIVYSNDSELFILLIVVWQVNNKLCTINNIEVYFIVYSIRNKVYVLFTLLEIKYMHCLLY